MGNASSGIQQLSVAQYAQLINARALSILAHHMPDFFGLVSVSGTIANLDAANGGVHYGVRLHDGAATCVVDVPVALINREAICNGDKVLLAGVPRIRLGKFGAEVKLDVSHAQKLDAYGSTHAFSGTQGGGCTLSQLKAIASKENRPFPRIARGRPLRIAVLHSRSAQSQVLQDFMSELAVVSDGVQLIRIPINMLEPQLIAQALSRVEADLVAIIRGGGNEEEFLCYDDLKVMQAFAQLGAYRIVGLGHSRNVTGLDFLSDFSARTPGQAGVHVREQIQLQLTGVSAPRIETPAVALQPVFVPSARRRSIRVALALGIIIGAVLTLILT